jgi:hypothetical protein
MKRHVLITAVLAAMMTVASGANAEPDQQQEFVVELKAQDAKRLSEVAELLKRLHQMGALDVTEYGEVKVKNSFIEALNRQGRMSTEKMGNHVICN